MEVQLGESHQTHIGVENGAGGNAGEIHNAILTHPEFLHIGEVCLVGQIGAGDGAHRGIEGGQIFPSVLGHDVGGRDIQRHGGGRVQLPAEAQQLLEAGIHGIQPLPGVVAEFVSIVHIVKTQRLVVIAVIAQLAALAKNAVSKVGKAGGVRLGFGCTGGVILIIFDNQANQGQLIFLTELLDVREPDIHIKFGHADMIVPGDVFRVALGDGGGHIIQENGCAVEHRIGGHILQQTIGGSHKASGGVVIETKIIHDHASLAALVAPNQGVSALVVSGSIDGYTVPQLHGNGGIEAIGDVKGVSAAHNEVVVQPNAVNLNVVASVEHAGAPQNKVAAGVDFQGHGKHGAATAANPVINGEKPVAKGIHIRGQDDHGFIGGQVVGNLHVADVNEVVANLHIQKHSLHVGVGIHAVFATQVCNQQAVFGRFRHGQLSGDNLVCGQIGVCPIQV